MRMENFLIGAFNIAFCLPIKKNAIGELYGFKQNSLKPFQIPQSTLKLLKTIQISIAFPMFDHICEADCVIGEGFLNLLGTYNLIAIECLFLIKERINMKENEIFFKEIMKTMKQLLDPCHPSMHSSLVQIFYMI